LLRQHTNAIFGDAPTGAVDGDSIRIDPALAGQTVALSAGELEITDDWAIRGFGTTVQVAVSERIFSINTSGAVALPRLNLENRP